MTYSQKSGASKKIFINTDQSYDQPNLSYSKAVNQSKNGQQYYTPRNDYQNQQYQIPQTSQPQTARNKPRIFDDTIQDSLNRSVNNGMNNIQSKTSRSPSPFNQTMPSNIKVMSMKDSQALKMEQSRSKTPTGQSQTQQANNLKNSQYSNPQGYQSNKSPRNTNNHSPQFQGNIQAQNNYYPGPGFQNERLQNMQYNSSTTQQPSKQQSRPQKAPFSSNSVSSNDNENPYDNPRQTFNDSRSQLDNSLASARSKRTKPIVVMNINVSQNQKEEIRVYEGDNPSDVALAFCQKYNLDPRVHKVLEKNIKAQTDKFYQMLDEKIKSNASFANSNHSSIKNPDYAQIPSRNSYSNKDEQEYNNPPPSEQASLKPYAISPRNKKPANYEDYDEDPPYKPRRSLSSKAPKSQQDYDEPSDVRKQFNAAKSKVISKIKPEVPEKQLKKPQEKRYSTEDDEIESTFHPVVNKKSSEMTQGRGNAYELLAKDANMKKDRIEKTQMLKQMHELDGHTFKPEINNKSRQLVGNNPTRSKTPIHEKLYGDALARKNTEESLGPELDPEHTFTPRINKESKRIVEKNPNKQSVEVHDRLYQEKNRQAENLEKKRREAEKSNYVDPKTGQKLYQPQIDRNTIYYQKAAKRTDAAYVEEVVEIDPEDYYDKINKTYDGPSQMSSQDLDNRSFNQGPRKTANANNRGQNYDNGNYQSSTPRGNNKASNRDQSPISYISAKDVSPKNTKSPQTGRNQAPERQEKLQKSPVDPKSLTGFKLSNLEKQLLAEIFNALDGDGDGRISQNDVDLSGVDSEILVSISEVIMALEDDGTVLTFKDFVNMINQKEVLNKLREIHKIPAKSDDESNPSDYSDNLKNQGYSGDDHDGQSTSEVSDYSKENEQEKMRQNVKYIQNAVKRNEPPLTKHYKQMAKKH